MNLHSDKIPEVNYSPPIQDLFMFFGINWATLSPVIYLLLGTLFGLYVIKLLMSRFAN